MAGFSIAMLLQLLALVFFTFIAMNSRHKLVIYICKIAHMIIKYNLMSLNPTTNKIDQLSRWTSFREFIK